KLKGTSPELETTRPVHLNINTEQNLLSLLKSLRFAEGISANIDRKVRQQYDESTSNH
ncbi:MAG: YdbH domain-containing protein, partial [Thiotrichales bacterium]